MIYQIKDEYYINIAPHIYKKINLCLKGDELILVPTNKTVEIYKMYEVKQIYFASEKDKLKEKLFPMKTNKVASKKPKTSKRR